MSKPIEDYALLSDCHSAALVSKDGSIDWLCFPCFDSAACFASLLGTNENGRWAITPTEEFKVSRKYIEGTMVLETTFETSQGSCVVTDCMLIGDENPSLVRCVEGIKGQVNLLMELIIRFDYGSIVPWVRKNENRDGLHAVAGPEAVVLYSPMYLRGENLHTQAEFVINEKEKKFFTLIWFQSHLPVPKNIPDPYQEIIKTAEWWKRWSDQCKYEGFDKEAVKRSLITLKALTYEPTGAIVAAPTTSLPETINGERNWDYRFGWIRDSSFTLWVLLHAGYQVEAIRWNEWLLRAIAGTPSQVNIMYGIRAERRLTELELPWLPGYENSKPVRIGNEAYSQFQLDVFGELMATAHLGRANGIAISENSWRIEQKMIKYVCDHWREPDNGIWEVRGPARHFTHSKMMAWVALDNAVKAVREFNLCGDAETWAMIRDEIHDEICRKGFNKELNSFVQFYNSDVLDASLLMMPLVRFLPIDDPRVIGTVRAIQKYLVKDGLVLRYIPDPAIDGLHGEEGSFIPCSFWLVSTLELMGEHEEAMALYNHLLSLRNDVGLFSEEYSTVLNRQVGNFPQAFSHISQIAAAMGFSS